MQYINIQKQTINILKNYDKDGESSLYLHLQSSIYM